MCVISVQEAAPTLPYVVVYEHKHNVSNKLVVASACNLMVISRSALQAVLAFLHPWQQWQLLLQQRHQRMSSLSSTKGQ